MNIVITLVLAVVLVDVADGYCSINDGLKLINHDGSPDDKFGVEVAIHNGTVVVGSWRDDVDGRVDVGSIQVYTLSGSTVQLKAKLTPNDAKTNDYCGFSVALNSKYIVVGCVLSYNKRGTVYVYHYGGNARKWVYKQLVADEGRPDDGFGYSIAINDNNELVVGAPWIRQGSAYVFSHNGTDWVLTQTLNNFYIYDGFGRSIAISNTHIVVGRPGDPVIVRRTGFTVPGTVDIYVKTPTTWEQRTTIESPNPQIKGYFGSTVSIYDKRVAIGAYGERKVFVYVNGVNNAWSLETTLTGDVEDFGWPVSINRYTIVIGANESVYAYQMVDQNWKEIVTKFTPSVSVSDGKVVVGNTDAKPEAAYVFNSLNCSITSTASLAVITPTPSHAVITPTPSHAVITPTPSHAVITPTASHSVIIAINNKLVVAMAIVAIICWIKH